MPIYEYRCEKCGAVHEMLLLGREEKPACKSCGSDDLTKLMSAPNISVGGDNPSFGPSSGGCCGSPGSCESPGHCCGG
ncbi:MAG TPA: zinc ribbon domain-containing protein [Syntrophorhabdaceae bacterium]|jgi:putative FmdB family regulatory protein